MTTEELMLPERLVLIRHAPSIGNLANERSWYGDQSDWTAEFRSIPPEHWRIIPKGRAQSRSTGRFLLDTLSPVFHEFRTSPDVRARETAGWLVLPKAEWILDSLIGERNRGEVGMLSPHELRERFATEMVGNEFRWIPPGGGESIEMLSNTRGVQFIESLYRRWNVESPAVCCVSHAHTMLAIDAKLRGLTVEEASDVMAGRNGADDGWLPKRGEIENLRVLAYSRRNWTTGELSPYFRWTAQFNPLDLSRSPNYWREIERPYVPMGIGVRRYYGRTLTNAELIAEATHYPIPASMAEPCESSC